MTRDDHEEHRLSTSRYRLQLESLCVERYFSVDGSAECVRLVCIVPTGQATAGTR